MSKYLCDNAYEILQNNPESALLLNSIRSTYYILAQALEGRNCFKDKLDALASISSSVKCPLMSELNGELIVARDKVSSSAVYHSHHKDDPIFNAHYRVCCGDVVVYGFDYDIVGFHFIVDEQEFAFALLLD
ncbi:hypothetical protein [Vibrio anguillarum]|uniref:Uncharacterized protein n=1 Tax=Vibrio anguillarum TaxID=55601 RepID=A0A7U6FS05_VIBAN|nr:hypothetical protein [Vibrio anguillarum]AZS26245.1 hypothetical protein DYL72_15160 [Vibrio anguillarum]MBF4374526.1 hypothetical protein [Vibrio anguillarum]MBF4436497.1 hypothetical protein [Vibrio anguillarum]